MKNSPLPASRAYTIFISVLLLGLVIYGIATGNPFGYVIAGVLFVFIGLPALIIFVVSRTQRQRHNPLHNGHDATLDATMPVGPDEPRDGDGEDAR
ncbi:MAG: hypothetical protein ACRDHP_14160 [Ktedonobacterales bacterium]